MQSTVIYIDQFEIETIVSQSSVEFKATHVFQHELKGELRVMSLKNKDGFDMTIIGHADHRLFTTAAGDYLLLELNSETLKSIQ